MKQILQALIVSLAVLACATPDKAPATASADLTGPAATRAATADASIVALPEVRYYVINDA